MRALSTWSTRRVLVACVLWLVGAPVLAAIGLLLAGVVLALFSGHQRIGFTASLNTWTLAWFYVPPILLVVAWLFAGRRASAGSGGGSFTPPDHGE